jgi:hypothetical protein
MVLAAFAAVVAALAVTLLPVPVWASRMLRSKSPHKALPPAGEAAEVDRALGPLLTEINTAIDLVGQARESLADYAAAAPLGWMFAASANDNWWKTASRKAHYDEGEATQAVERVVQALAEVPPEIGSRIEGAADSLASLFADLAPKGRELVPGRRTRRAEARRQVQRLEATIGQLVTLRDTLTANATDPYRG